MSLDGIVINSLVYELSNKIINGRIDKIYQPEKDEIILNIRSDRNNYKLILSASSNNPRIHIINTLKDNPMSPPMFCMLLRKHLQGAKITNISQTSFERIVNIHISSYDELGVLKEKLLTIEIMGRHSNIILIDSDNNKIIDSIKRVPPSLSSVRQVLPGMEYSLPPNQDKLNPLLIDKDTFINIIQSHNEGTLCYKFLYEAFMGISPLISKEICYNANIELNTKIGENINIENLYNSFNSLFDKVRKCDYEPNIIFDSNKNVISFSAIDINQFSDVSKKCDESMSSILQEYYVVRDSSDRIKQKSSSLKKNISNKLERNLNKLSKQKKELFDSTKREKYKIYGDLIISNIYKIEDSQKELECQNYYSEDLETLKIPLDPRLNPSQNAQKYYKKYNKLKSAYEVVSLEIHKTNEDIDYLENVLLSIENCSNPSELDEIREEVAKEGYLKLKNNRKDKKDKKNKNNVSKPQHYISSDGYDIYVGKNNNQNDYLTMKFADKNDYWLHTKEIPGSHVIIKSKGSQIPDDTIIEAATLAAFFSKAKMSSNVPVDYTERKNVKKPNGSKPGMVIYENNNTIYVTPDESKINELKKVN